MIRSKEEQIKRLSVLKPEDGQDISFCIQQLQSIVDSSKVSQETINTMYNVLTLLTTMKEKHTAYLITWLKQGFMED